MNPRKTYALILTGAALWCALILLAPYLASVSSPLGEFVYRSFDPICHQLPERSFHIFGEKLAVCTRCSSIYFAFLAGTLVYPLIRTSANRLLRRITDRSAFIVALLPMVIDVGFDSVGLHESGLVTRTLTGIAFGFIVPFIVVPAALEGVQLSTTKPSIIEHQKGISNA